MFADDPEYKIWISLEVKEEPTGFSEGSESDELSDDESEKYSSEISDDDNEALLTAEWNNSCEDENKNVCSFQEQTGIREHLIRKDPTDFFEMLFTEELLLQIVWNVNQYGTKLRQSRGNKSRAARWSNITLNDIKVFLGLLFHMGTYISNDMSNYWKSDEIHGIPIFKNSMGRDKFLLIMQYLNFENIDNAQGHQMPQGSFIVDYFNKIMEKTFKPDKILCIDESLVFLKDQYLRGKESKDGVKLHLLADQYGLVQKVLVLQEDKNKKTKTKVRVNEIIHMLLEERLGVGHSVYMNKYYNSIGLSKHLMSRNTHTTGILMPDGKGIPSDITQKQLKKGEKITKYSPDGISLTKWMDRAEILVISTEHSGEWEERTTKSQNVCRIPTSISKYNHYRGAVERHKQMMSYYNCQHKTTNWYKKLGIHILQMLLVNSHNLYNRYGEKSIPLAEYRTVIIRHLLRKDEVSDTSERNFTEMHTLIKIVTTPLQKRGRKRCVICYKNNKRTTVQTTCSKCPKQPGLCMGKCFEEYHLNLKE
ncbi:piggyBac transposable element-derived protein 4-like [Cydia strobilella]|uniref:piggyBac transposable element-derived protein 4-like n=1 Tax=Cydia strobilella TaxID=1100964 RepID=UPI003004D2E8